MFKSIISTDKTIVKKVAKKLNIDEIKVRRVLSASIDYMVELTEQDKIYSICIPYVRKLNFNTTAFKRDRHLKEKYHESVFLKRERKYTSYKIGEKKHDELEALYKELKESGKKYSIPIHFRRKNLNFCNAGTNKIYQLEDHQNGWAEQKEDYEDNLEKNEKDK